jgi:hypothetical protein
MHSSKWFMKEEIGTARTLSSRPLYQKIARNEKPYMRYGKQDNFNAMHCKPIALPRVKRTFSGVIAKNAHITRANL